MAILKTALNYTEAVQVSFSDSANRLISDEAELLLVEWGHFVPAGTDFIEVNVTCGWENITAEDEPTLEFRIYQNGALVFSADDHSSEIGTDNDTLSSFKAVLTSPVNQHNVYQLTAIVTQSVEGTDARIDGPFTISTVSFGTP